MSVQHPAVYHWTSLSFVNIASLESQNIPCRYHVNYGYRFEVYFVGAETRVDMRPSSDWLRDKTSDWNFPVHIQV